MDLLVKNELLKVEKEGILNALESMAKSSLGYQVPDCKGLTGFQFYRVFKKFKDKPEIVEKLNETNWYLLRDACYEKIDFSSLPLEMKERITKPRDETIGVYLRLLNEKASKV